MPEFKNPYSPKERELDVCGLRLAVRLWHGDQVAAPALGAGLLALHGWLDNAATFDRLAPLLPEMPFAAVDLPGHGLSDWRGPGNAYHFVDWVPDVFGIADALGWERFVLLGHSMGAGIASLAGGVMPERVTRLVLIEGLGPFVDDPEAAPECVRQYTEERAGREKKRSPVHPSLAAAAESLRRVVPTLSTEAAELLVARGTKPETTGVSWRSDPRLRRVASMRFTEAHVQAFLRRISAPTLLVRADQGWPLIDDMLATRVACIADATMTKLAGGHHLHLDHAEPVAAVIREFLRGDAS
jgi:pimeloyl-ACP methyl ester carboxylesterase